MAKIYKENINIKKSILEVRKKNSLSQEEFAKKLGVTKQVISEWELGLSLPNMENIIKMSEIFKISIDYLLTNDFQNLKLETKLIKTRCKKYLSILLIIIGILGLMTLPFLAEYKRYKEIELFKSAYESSINYLFKYPLVILLIFFSLITIIGICILVKKFQKTKKER